MPDFTTPVVTRFAPSPTGFLHIGGARTALFNWAYAKAKGGKMLLRIEDTDRERSTQAAIDAILDGLTWLGLDWDDTPVFQSERGTRHREVVDALLALGAAYHCYASQEELADMREQARQEGLPPRYDGRWRDRDPAEAPDDVAPVVRFKAPQAGETALDDHVQGNVVFPNKDLDDLIILRSDGTPTYNLSVVVDDHDMGVTHIVRGVDHLTNAARQSQIYRALDWPVPDMAHIPLIHGPDGAKLSKRHGALGVEAYREMGVLPDAMRNYLARLGWSHGDDEVFSTDQLIAWFDLDGIGQSAARFDMAKLENLNGRYVRTLEPEAAWQALHGALPHLPGGSALLDRLTPEREARIKSLLPALQERAKTLVELKDGAEFLLAERPLTYDEKAQTLLLDDGQAVLAGVLDVLDPLPDWDLDAIDAAVRSYAETADLKLGKVAQPLRAALTGRSTSPGIFDVLHVLGRDEALGRITDALARQDAV
ncbi:MAG: glutamate--tRNA ligase [Pseudomonadota bacterium]